MGAVGVIGFNASANHWSENPRILPFSAADIRSITVGRVSRFVPVNPARSSSPSAGEKIRTLKGKLTNATGSEGLINVPSGNRYRFTAGYDILDLFGGKIVSKITHCAHGSESSTLRSRRGREEKVADSERVKGGREERAGFLAEKPSCNPKPRKAAVSPPVGPIAPGDSGKS